MLVHKYRHYSSQEIDAWLERLEENLNGQNESDTEALATISALKSIKAFRDENPELCRLASNLPGKCYPKIQTNSRDQFNNGLVHSTISCAHVTHGGIFLCLCDYSKEILIGIEEAKEILNEHRNS